MMYIEVNLEIIVSLKARGYKNVQFILQSSDNRRQAAVEVIPGREDSTGLDLIPLNSAEIGEYFDQPSPMTKYMIDQKFLQVDGGKLKVESLPADRQVDSQDSLYKEIKTMKEKSLGDKLRVRREFHGFSQEYVGAKLNMTQSAVSWIENGKTKFTADLVQKVKEIEKFENFDEGTPEHAENLVTQKLPLLAWPWGKTSLYITYSIVGLLLLNLASIFADDFSRGLGATGGANVYLVAGLTLFFFALFCLIIYMLISLINRVANKKIRKEKGL